MRSLPRCLITPFADDGTPLPSLSRPAGQVVNVIPLTAADLSAPAGLFLVTANATPVPALSVAGLVIHTTNPGGSIFYTVLFPGQLF